MKIGFYIKWDKNSLNSKGNVIGDELWGESLSKSIKNQFEDIQCELYAPNFLPKKKLDILIYLNDTKPNHYLAKKHVLYLQNGYGEEAENLIREFVKFNYDGYIFFSKRLQEIFKYLVPNKKSIYLPFGVDTTLFYPRDKNPDFEFDCAYIGNDIKGEDATMKYLYPAINFNFGLFGNWKIYRHKKKFWKNFERKAPYKKMFEKISRGKIDKEDVPVLYSSAKINLNCTLQDCIDWDVITLRTYEVLACKGFLITDIVPSAFETMQGCIVFTTGGNDLKEKIRFYLENKEEREKIAEKGYEYVIKYCSIDERAKELINYIKGV
jgi:spore maturation protein CgeB